MRSARVFVALVVLLGVEAMGCGAGDGNVRVKGVRLQDDGSTLHAVVSMHNGTLSPVYTYSSARRLVWDDATKTLTLALSESECTDPAVCMHYFFPSYARIGPYSDEDVVITLPRELTKLGPKGDTPGLSFVKEPIAGATRLVVDVAWTEAPVRSSSQGENPRTTVRKSEREVLRAEWRRPQE